MKTPKSWSMLLSIALAAPVLGLICSAHCADPPATPKAPNTKEAPKAPKAPNAKQAKSETQALPTSKQAKTAILRYDKIMAKAKSIRDRSLKNTKASLMQNLQTALNSVKKSGNKEQSELILLTIKKIKGEEGQSDILQLQERFKEEELEIQKFKEAIKKAQGQGQNAAANKLFEKQVLAEKKLIVMKKQLQTADQLQGEDYDPATAPLQAGPGKAAIDRYKREMAQLTKNYQTVTHAAFSVRNKFLDNAMKLAANKKNTAEVDAIKKYLDQASDEQAAGGAIALGGKWKDLMSSTELSKHGNSSSWKIEGGVLTCSSVGIGRYRTSVLPDVNYDVLVQFTRLHTDRGSFMIALPLSDQTGVMLTIGTGTKELSGLSNINGRTAQTNGAGIANRLGDKQMSLLINVRRPFKDILTINATLNGKTYVSYQGPMHRLRQPDYWRIDKPYSLGIASRNRCVKIHTLKWAPAR